MDFKMCFFEVRAVITRVACCLDNRWARCLCSGHQPSVATSTTEAEYVMASDMNKEAVCISKILPDMQWCRGPLPSCVTTKAQSSWRETHTRDKTHSHPLPLRNIRKHQESGEIEINYVESTNKLTDIFTKSLAGPSFSNLRQCLGVVPLLT